MIRLATGSDMLRLLEMGRAFNEEAGYAEQVPFCVESFTRTLTVLGNAGLILVMEDETGDVIGMAAADVAASICNHKILVGREAFWYISPAHRFGPDRRGRQLLAALEKTVKDRGGHFFDVVAENGKREKALARLYRAASYSPAEITFRKAL